MSNIFDTVSIGIQLESVTEVAKECLDRWGIIHKVTPTGNNVFPGVSGIILCLAISFVILKMARSEGDLESLKFVFRGTIEAHNKVIKTDVDGEGYPFEYSQSVFTLKSDSLKQKFDVENSADVFSEKQFITGETAFIYEKKPGRYIISHEKLNDEQKEKIIGKYGCKRIYYLNFLWVVLFLFLSIGSFADLRENKKE